VVDVIVQYVQKEYDRQQALQRFVDSAEWVLDFLHQYPPHFSDGKSMATDIGEGLSDLYQSMQAVKADLQQQQQAA
jgi:uncharacterized membrane-anchored protein YhcB (DUF1043 family)